MAHAAITSPLRCRWISPGTEMRLEEWTYAICLRCRDHPRVVSEDECGHCACWEPSVDDGHDEDDADALHDQRQSASPR
jgi:hypothetical protein